MAFFGFAVLLIAFTLLGELLNWQAVGVIASNTKQLRSELIQMGIPAEKVANSKLPDHGWALLSIASFGAVQAGYTINTLFAFGEEYGWRGFLWQHLSHLGWIRANFITGTLWGLWHTPLIIRGYNYSSPYWGIVVMMIFCIGASFALSAVRLRGNILSASILHGMINGFSGFSILIVGDNPLIGGLIGVISAFSIFVVSVLLWNYYDLI